MKKLAIFVFLLAMTLVTGCGNANTESESGFETFGQDRKGKALEVKFLSQSDLELRINGKIYHLSQTEPQVKTPFDYRFATERQLDLRIGDQIYKLENPFVSGTTKPFLKASTLKKSPFSKSIPKPRKAAPLARSHKKRINPSSSSER